MQVNAYLFLFGIFFILIIGAFEGIFISWVISYIFYFLIFFILIFILSISAPHLVLQKRIPDSKNTTFSMFPAPPLLSILTSTFSGFFGVNRMTSLGGLPHHLMCVMYRSSSSSPIWPSLYTHTRRQLHPVQEEASAPTSWTQTHPVWPTQPALSQSTQ